MVSAPQMKGRCTRLVVCNHLAKPTRALASETDAECYVTAEYKPDTNDRIITRISPVLMR